MATKMMTVMMAPTKAFRVSELPMSEATKASPANSPTAGHGMSAQLIGMDMLLSVASSRAVRGQFTRSPAADAMAATRRAQRTAGGRGSSATLAEKQRFHPSGYSAVRARQLLCRTE